MVNFIGVGIIYIIVLVVTLRILKRSAILRDKEYVIDDAAQAQKGLTFSSEPEYGHVGKQLIIPSMEDYREKLARSPDALLNVGLK